MFRLGWATVTSLGLAALGLVFGLVGMKRSEKPRAARLGVILNAVVIFVVLVVVPLAWVVFE